MVLLSSPSFVVMERDRPVLARTDRALSEFRSDLSHYDGGGVDDVRQFVARGPLHGLHTSRRDPRNRGKKHWTSASCARSAKNHPRVHLNDRSRCKSSTFHPSFASSELSVAWKAPDRPVPSPMMLGGNRAGSLMLYAFISLLYGSSGKWKPNPYVFIHKSRAPGHLMSTLRPGHACQTSELKRVASASRKGRQQEQFAGSCPSPKLGY